MGGKSGGGKKGGASTPAPNFTNAATPNTSNPLGGQTWTKGPDGRLQSQMGFTGQAGEAFQNLLGGMGAASAYDPTKARDAAIQSNFDQGWSRLQPMQQQDQQRFNAGMANQGLAPGSQGFQTGLGNLQRGQADQFNSLMANAIRQGNETQGMQIQQMNQPFLQAGSMLSMLNQQGNNLSAPLTAAKMQYEAAKDATSASQGKKGQTMGGLGSLAGTVFGGPIGGALGGAAGNLLGGGGGGKKGGGAPPDNYFGTGDPMAGHG